MNFAFIYKSIFYPARYEGKTLLKTRKFIHEELRNHTDIMLIRYNTLKKLPIKPYFLGTHMKKDLFNKCKHKSISGNITTNIMQVNICIYIYISDGFNLDTFIFYDFPS